MTAPISGGTTFDAATVMSLADFLNPAGRRLRIFTTDDVVKESRKLQQDARVQVNQQQQVEANQEERLAATTDTSMNRLGGTAIPRTAPTVGSSAPDGALSLNSFAFARRV